MSAKAGAEIQLPANNISDRIVVAADSGSSWVEGVYDVYVLHGNCYINQGLTYARSQDAVIWVERGGPGGEPPHKVIAYLEGDVQINYQQADSQGKAAGAATLTDKTWFGRFYSVLPVDVRPKKQEPPPAVKPPAYAHALAARDPGAAGQAEQAQFAEPVDTPPATVGPPPGMMRIRIQGRSAVKPEAEAFPVPNTNEGVAIFKSGVNIVVDGLDNFGSIDVDTDNLVIWTEGQLTPNAENQSVQPKDRPLEIYMEGNIVFRQGQRTIFAQRMYYDIRRQTGIVLSAEMLTPVPKFEGLMKLRAEVLQMTGPDRFLAQNASITSSRFGVPGYELRTGLMTYEDVQHPRINPITGTPEVDAHGEPVIDHEKMAVSRNNFLYVEQVPVFYWPVLATDLDKPNYYVNSVQVMSDRVFGTRVMTDIDAYQVLGIKNRLPGTRWTLSADYFSKRGPGGGTTFNYEKQTLFGVPASTNGFVDAWAIDDHGVDNLGLDRRDLIPPQNFRGRVLAQHRQLLPDNFQLTGEFGKISDFNFLEEYFEREWDQLKDQSTDLELKQYVDNSSWSLIGAVRLNDFFTETQWLPRLDHYWLGQSLLGDRLTWYEHSNIGYGQMKTLSPPTDPTDAAVWGTLPWEGPANSTHQGDRLVTRNEFDLPFAAGAAKLDPYVLGQLAHWGQNLNGDDQSQAYGAFGMRGSLPFWSVNPAIQSTLFNVNGIAHKVVLDADVSYAQATSHLSTLPLYDPLDDNDIEAYRRKFTFYDFGGPPPVPPQYDERFYALRRGLGNWIASPSSEIADDLFAARLGMRHRWQTKRGPIGKQRIIDWITFNTDITIFPNASRDNFGETFGLLDYDFRWHVGDRTTVVSEGYFDFFANAPQYFTVGTFLNRPPRGSIYFGFRSLNGPISSNVLLTSYTYRMSPKWMSTFGTSFDIAESRNIGQNFTITRIGESFLTMFNINVDTSKGNVGASIAIQPRFLQGRLGPPSGLTVPMAGVYGLE
ncbi:MAG TPA: hypothetical protein VHV08_07335 [Pirellulales bacterium]|nr:hypothetical protein [Pirellulales bacterium]